MTLRPGIGWLDAMRDEGRAAFRAHGLPTTKMENWKYTNLKALDEFAFARPSTSPEFKGELLDFGGPRLVFVNGVFAPGLSKGLSNTEGQVLPLSAALDSNANGVQAHLGKIAIAVDPLAALNSRVIDDGIALLLHGRSLSKPVVVEHISTATGDGVACHPRNLIVIENDARAVLVERFSGVGRYLVNPVTEIVLADKVEFFHYRLFDDDDAAFNLSHTHVRIGRDALYDAQILSLGGALLRNEIRVDLVAPQAAVYLAGAYLARGRQHVDHTTVIRHDAPHTTSRELFKGALDGHARGVFQGNIRVAKGSDGTDGLMTNKTLLLSDRAEMDSKPQLEIYADDVKCAHGATVGELEEEALFYMRARGIPERQARAMLIEGFVGTAFEPTLETDVGDLFKTRIAQWLQLAAIKEAA